VNRQEQFAGTRIESVLSRESNQRLTSSQESQRSKQLRQAHAYSNICLREETIPSSAFLALRNDTELVDREASATVISNLEEQIIGDETDPMIVVYGERGLSCYFFSCEFGELVVGSLSERFGDDQRGVSLSSMIETKS